MYRDKFMRENKREEETYKELFRTKRISLAKTGYDSSDRI